ncbi:MAG: beta-N-acetylglucosaminidase domain-containing protein [Victivallaceae bacterium]|nr:beta-N-acetylglucosaminidase domain-containing protein [Victivallaceae bacterium]
MEIKNIPWSNQRDLYKQMKNHGMMTIGHMSNPYYLKGNGWKEKSKRKINIANSNDVNVLIEHYRKALNAGATSIMLMTDDFMDVVNKEFVLSYPEETEMFKTVGNAHVYLANKVYDTLIKEFPKMDMSFCPPYYASYSHLYRWPRTPQIAKDYLLTIGKGINPEIKLLMTGPLVTSYKITEKDFHDMAMLFGNRLPHIWDNTSKVSIGYRSYFTPFTTYMPQKYLNNYEYFNSCIDSNSRSLAWRLILISVGDALWNPNAYNAERSFRNAICSYFGPEIVEPLLEFGNLCSFFRVNGNKKILPLKKRLFFENFAIEKKLPWDFCFRGTKLIPNCPPLPDGRHVQVSIFQRGYILRCNYQALNIPLNKLLQNGELRFWLKSSSKDAPLRVFLWCDNDKKSFMEKTFTPTDDKWNQYTVSLINMKPKIQKPPAKAITGIGFYSVRRHFAEKITCNIGPREIGTIESAFSLVKQKQASLRKMRQIINKLQATNSNKELVASMTVIYEELLKEFNMILHNSAKPLAVKSCKDKITLDGKLDEAAWKDAASTPDFVSYKDEKVKITKTYAKIAYNIDNLYIGFFCKAEKWDDAQKIPKGAADRDSATFKCDSVEVFLDPGCTHKKYYQFGTNVIGGFLDKEVGYDNLANSWNPDWQVKTFREKDFWSVEIAIPISVFKLKNKQLKGREWGANFCRTNVPKNELGVWKSLNGKSFHSPSLWGKIIFK